MSRLKIKFPIEYINFGGPYFKTYNIEREDKKEGYIYTHIYRERDPKSFKLKINVCL